jgi:hypothetical protein
VPPLGEVLDAIARAVLGDTSGRDAWDGAANAAATTTAALGGVTLRAHQRDALRRVRASIARVGGVLLADAPGLGKTYVALALARECPPAIVVAPAALRAMWRAAASTAGANVAFVSLESLSHHDHHPAAPGGLVIVDEAHHACNPGAARYARLARLAAWRRVLLLSATPVRNRRAELGALLALFMGPRAYALGDAARARCIVRRRGDAALLPRIDGPHWHHLRSVAGIASAIAQLPPPLPPLDGGAAGALVATTLARCWASSLAALDAALRRRLQRGAALASVLDAGRMPTRNELRSWVIGDDAVQLAFPALAAHQAADAMRLGLVLESHLRAVRALRSRIAPHVVGDTARRARLLLRLRGLDGGSRTVAFTAHAATAEAVYRALSRKAGVALLTARGARTAGGTRPRADVIAALSGAASVRGSGTGGGTAARRGHDDISLVVTTDLLGEGVNLQGASVVVHLDVPWTPAGLDQRVGRAARMGSPHECVRVHGIAPPAAAARMLKLDRRLVRKHAESAHAVRPADDAERLRTLVAPWRRDQPAPRVPAPRRGPTAPRVPAATPAPAAPAAATMLAIARAHRTGFIAVVNEDGNTTLACGVLRGRGRWHITDAPGDVCELVQVARDGGLDAISAAGGRRAQGPAAGGAGRARASLEAPVRAALDRWLEGRRAWTSTGLPNPPSPARRSILARIDSVIAGAGAHARATAGARVARVRTLVEHAVGAGAECALAELARMESPRGDVWLTECERRLGAGTPRTCHAAAAPGAAPPALRALLLLRRRG